MISLEEFFKLQEDKRKKQVNELIYVWNAINNLDENLNTTLLETNNKRFDLINYISHTLAGAILNAIEKTKQFNYADLKELIKNNKPVFKLTITKPDIDYELPNIYLAQKTPNDDMYGAYDPTSDGIILNILDEHGYISHDELVNRIHSNVFVENLAHEIAHWMQSKIKKEKNIPWKNINYNTVNQYYKNKLEAEAFRTEAINSINSFFLPCLMVNIVSNKDKSLTEIINLTINNILKNLSSTNKSIENFIKFTSPKELKKMKKDICEYTKHIVLLNYDYITDIFNNKSSNK